MRQALVFSYNSIDDSIFDCRFVHQALLIVIRVLSAFQVTHSTCKNTVSEQGSLLLTTGTSTWHFRSSVWLLFFKASTKEVYKVCQSDPNKGVSPWHVISLGLGRSRFMSCLFMTSGIRV